MGAATALLGVATGLQAFGSFKSGEDQAALAGYNADVAKAQGEADVRQAAAQEQIQRRDIQRVQARQRLLIASSGAGGGGTYEDVQASTAAEGELEALKTRYGGVLAKRRAAAGAALSKGEGEASQAGGILGALTAGAAGGYDVLRESQRR